MLPREMKWRLTFKPLSAWTHFHLPPGLCNAHVAVLILFSGSPFFVKVSDSNQSMVSGASLRTSSIARPAKFTIDSKGSENTDCKVTVVGKEGVCCHYAAYLCLKLIIQTSMVGHPEVCYAIIICQSQAQHAEMKGKLLRELKVGKIRMRHMWYLTEAAAKTISLC